jgi:uncharacterized protein (DUF2141 family)
LSEPNPQPAAVTVNVVNVRTHAGSVMAALHDERGWSAPAVSLVKVPANADTVTLRLEAPSAGRYGIQLYHDVDGDGELDANLVGIPSEPFGFSNDAPLRFGPPSFEDAAFDIGPSGAELTITLR